MEVVVKICLWSEVASLKMYKTFISKVSSLFLPKILIVNQILTPFVTHKFIKFMSDKVF